MNANITSLKKSDLKSLGVKLEYLWLNDNSIEVLESDVFDHTPNLEDINFENNKIQQIGEGTFSQLQALNYLDFEGNLCHSGHTWLFHSISSLLKEVNDKCVV